jgi:glutamine amidotransferase
VRRWIAADRPFLGVCLGMQALFERSEEGDTPGLGIFAGTLVRFRLPPAFKIPAHGVEYRALPAARFPFGGGIAAMRVESFYFVHSFHCRPADRLADPR